jgi:translation initiation factor 2-alpha kinase 4
VRLIVQLQMKSRSQIFKKSRDKNPIQEVPVRRCDTLVASFDSRTLRSAGLRVMTHLWRHGLSAELASDTKHLDDLLRRYMDDKYSWVVIVKNEATLNTTEVKVVSLPSMHDVDVSVEGLIQYLDLEIKARDEIEGRLTIEQSTRQDRTRTPFRHNSSPSIQTMPAPSTDRPPNVHFLIREHKGKKTNRANAIEFASSSITSLLSSFRDAPVAAVEVSDDTLESIRGARLGDAESWRKVVQAAPAGERAYLQQLQGMLEGFRGEWEQDRSKERVAWVFNFRTGWSCLYDLGV